MHYGGVMDRRLNVSDCVRADNMFSSMVNWLVGDVSCHLVTKSGVRPRSFQRSWRKLYMLYLRSHMSRYWLVNHRGVVHRSYMMHGRSNVMNCLRLGMFLFNFRLLFLLLRLRDRFLLCIFFRLGRFPGLFCVLISSNFLFVEVKLLLHELLEKLFRHLDVLYAMVILSNSRVMHRLSNFDCCCSRLRHHILNLRPIRRNLIGGNAIGRSDDGLSDIARLGANESRLGNDHATHTAVSTIAVWLSIDWCAHTHVAACQKIGVILSLIGLLGGNLGSGDGCHNERDGSHSSFCLSDRDLQNYYKLLLKYLRSPSFSIF